MLFKRWFRGRALERLLKHVFRDLYATSLHRVPNSLFYGTRAPPLHIHVIFSSMARTHSIPSQRLTLARSHLVGMKTDGIFPYHPVPFSTFFRPFSYLQDSVFVFAEVENGVFRSFPSNPVLIRNRPVFILYLSRCFQSMLKMFNNYMSLCYVNITTNH
jgi:hypothetical protein